MTIRVTVHDEETGDEETKVIPDGEYIVITTDPCYVSYAQAHANGTHVLTIKGRIQQ